MGCHASAWRPTGARQPEVAGQELATSSDSLLPDDPATLLNILTRKSSQLSGPTSSNAPTPRTVAKRLRSDIAELQARLQQSRAVWQEEEEKLKKSIMEKAAELQLTVAGSATFWRGRRPPPLPDMFEVEIAYQDRGRFPEVVKSMVPGLGLAEPELRRSMHVTDAQGCVLPQHVGFPADKSAYPLRARYREPEVRISNPRLRGLRLGDLLDFFEREVGEIISEGPDESKRVCIPTKLARVCNRFNLRHRGHSKFDLAPNLYAVEALFIRPMTEQDRISVAELWREEGVLIEAFVSHCWVEDFGEFCQSTYRFALHRARKNSPGLSNAEVDQRARELTLYVCAFSNNQWNLSAELGEHIEDSPFYKVLKAETTATVVMNMDQMGALMFRAWCTFEFYVSLELKKELVLNTRFGPLRDIKADREDGKVIEVWIIHVFELLQDVDIRLAQATSQEDLAMIQHSICSFVGTGVAAGLHGAEALNKLLKSMIADQALPLLARVGNSSALGRALDCGASPDAEDHRHVRALTYAAALHGRRSPPAQVLLARGADPLAAVSAELVVAMFGEVAAGRKKAIRQVLGLPEAERRLHASAVWAAQEEHAARVRAALELLTLNSWATVPDDAQVQELSGSPKDPLALSLGRRAKPLLALEDAVAPPSPGGKSQIAPESVALHLSAPDEDARRAACEVLGDLGRAAAPHAEELAERLQDEAAAVRRAALAALARMGDAAAPRAAAIAQRLNDGDHGVREAACEALAQLGKAAEHHLPALADALSDEDGDVRSAACAAFKQLGSMGAAHTPELAGCLADESPCVRLAALGALAQLGEGAASSAGAIAGCLGDEDWRIREAACMALAQMGEAALEYAPSVAQTLHDKDGDVRRGACGALAALAQYGQEGACHAPQLAECLADADGDVRGAACQALAQMGDVAAPHMPAIAECLADQDVSVRRAACKGLAQMGEAAMPFSCSLRERLADGDEGVRAAACSAWVRLSTPIDDLAGPPDGGPGPAPACTKLCL